MLREWEKKEKEYEKTIRKSLISSSTSHHVQFSDDQQKEEEGDGRKTETENPIFSPSSQFHSFTDQYRLSVNQPTEEDDETEENDENEIDENEIGRASKSSRKSLV